MYHIKSFTPGTKPVAVRKPITLTHQHCTVMYKNKKHFAVIIDQQFDKVKLNILSGNKAGEGTIVHTNWFENKEIHRIWNYEKS